MRHAAISLFVLAALGGPMAHAVELELPAGGGSFALRVASLAAIRYQSTVRQQYDFSCGSAAVATLLSYHYGFPADEQHVFADMYAHGDQAKIRREGFSLLDMKRYLAQHGFTADGYELPLAKLVQARYPAIVLVSDHGYQHFVVVKGVADGRVLLGDPAVGTRAMSEAAFDAIWRNRLLFVIHGWRGTARFNAVADWRAAPRAPLADAFDSRGLADVTLPKNGPGNF
ncbi:C39 family peptidase [Duganella sp. LX20W]|uniref:C39 family peptidase n=1 Tax=Rugamonas brunnea TaxID=2758569 RepID=A0A7W2EU57_9BURK|nr:C39 family peptidase [Rugamonas brunnea]MBA5638676.1 C39 family peptidase [Rugamonas brunnea]